MIFAEIRRAQLEERIVAKLAAEGLTLHRQNGLYQIEDADGLPVTELLSFDEVCDFVQRMKGG